MVTNVSVVLALGSCVEKMPASSFSLLSVQATTLMGFRSFLKEMLEQLFITRPQRSLMAKCCEQFHRVKSDLYGCHDLGTQIANNPKQFLFSHSNIRNPDNVNS